MNEKTLSLRVPAELVERIDTLVPAVASDGDYLYMRVSNSTVMRMALARGLEALEEEYGQVLSQLKTSEEHIAGAAPLATPKDFQRRESIEADLIGGKLSQSEIGRRHGCSRQYVNWVAREMKKEGKL